MLASSYHYLQGMAPQALKENALLTQPGHEWNKGIAMMPAD
jgi:hypothetical protein